ncbi:MAG: DnaJ domain-containing protein [Lachnospiraceae bacterium]|nr:DnaJ domain-containing protein [Lachnospiraceae bacterium]
MMDPYKTLGIARDASDEEIKKAYRTLIRKYHPDNNGSNPNKAETDRKFQEVQNAYQQIMYEKTHPYASSDRGYGSSYGSSGNTGSGYGNSYGGTGNSYGGSGGQYGGDPFGGFGWEDFWGAFTGAGNFGSERGQRAQSTENEQDLHYKAAANFINARRYSEAMNVLNGMSDRSAQWYYYSAVANAGLGNNVAAQSNAQTAVQMDPDNAEYRSLLQQLQYGSNWYQSRQTAYSPTSGGTARWCISLCLINIILNLFCGGSACCGTPTYYGRF